MKKIGIWLIVFLIGIGTLTSCGCKRKEKVEPVKANTNEEVTQDQTVEDFTFTNTSLVYENGTSRLETQVTNNSDEIKAIPRFRIHIKDQEGNIIVSLLGFAGDQLPAWGSIKITSTYGGDLSQAGKIDYEIIKE